MLKRRLRYLELILVVLNTCALMAPYGAIGAETAFTPAQLTHDEMTHLGMRIWNNESNTQYDGLTTWNEGEQFASLGIGHFIWYPSASEGPFEESFPALIGYLRQQSVSVPDWLSDEGMYCPWDTRELFLAQFNSPKMRQLRDFLAATVAQQSVFMVNRLTASLPKILNNAPLERRRLIETRFEDLMATPRGLFALLDYVNFKGEGTKLSERYRGEGWGLLQVLDAMTESPSDDLIDDFIQAATVVLARRVHNAPPARHEKRWLVGWTRRVQRYREEVD